MNIYIKTLFFFVDERRPWGYRSLRRSYLINNAFLDNKPNVKKIVLNEAYKVIPFIV